jgi:hypothetical protein
MAMAQGWHNLPLLYGQKVRRVEQVKGFSSGIKIGGKVIRCVIFLTLGIWTWVLRWNIAFLPGSYFGCKGKWRSGLS